MIFSAPLIKICLLAPAALAASPPVCSSTSPTPCRCPSGTSYAQSVTFAVIGAAAKDVLALTSDFFKTAWLGIVPIATQGPDNKVGSTRTYNVPSSEGVYNFTEQLTEFHSDSSGSFVQKFKLLTPVEFNTGDGSFAGYWVTLASESIFKYETAIAWSVYACTTGHPQNYAAFHESALANATSVLQAQGKILGSNVKPVSIQSF